MFLPEHDQGLYAISPIFFTKEFHGFEVESKWLLLTENPVPTILQFMTDVCEGYWDPFHAAKSMGKLSIGLRYFDLQFDFWAIKNHLSSRSEYRQIAMVAVIPGADMYQVAFKEGGPVKFLCDGQGFSNPPLIRREDRRGDWVKEKDAVVIINRRFPRAEKLASINRQKCYIYVHNVESYRNFSISADLCRLGSRTLSQVEVEYKGRNGIWLPDTTGHLIALDFLLIHEILAERYKKILLPTIQTKFEWIIGG
ncbi:MAG TPA: hypothetical protein ACFYEC_04455 [Candidatus Brocadiaceae bacterium]